MLFSVKKSKSIKFDVNESFNFTELITRNEFATKKLSFVTPPAVQIIGVLTSTFISDEKINKVIIFNQF